MTSMHVPDAVISLAVAPKDKRHGGQLLQGAEPLHQGGPHLPRPPRRGVRPDHHQRHGRAAPRDLHRAHEARVRLRGHRRQAAGGLPRDHHASRASTTTPTRSRPAARGQYAQGRRLHRAAARRSPRPASSSSTTSSGGSIPREFIPACDKGFKEADQEGPLIGFPVVGVRCVHQRRRVPRGRLVGNRLQDGGADGLPRGLHEGQADHPRADHEGRGPGPRGVPGRGHGRSSTSAAGPSSPRRSRRASSSPRPRCR